MKKIFILSIVLLNSLIGYSQINTWIINKGSILVGTYSSGQVINARNPDTRERFSFKHITFYPRVGVQITKNFLGGVYGNYGWIEGNLHPNFSYSGIGYFGRYYFFPTKTVCSYDSVGKLLLKIKIGNGFNKFLYQRVKLYAEVYHLFTNIYYDDRQITRINGYYNQIINIGLGTNIRIWKNLCLEYTVRANILPINPKQKFAFLGPGLGIDYFIPTKKIR